MTRHDIANEYFEWMCSLVDDPGRPRYISYEKLLHRLHETEFRYIMPRDENLAIWGMNLSFICSGRSPRMKKCWTAA